MTRNSAAKRAAREYQHKHPGTTYPAALRAVRQVLPDTASEDDYDPADFVLSTQEILRTALADDRQLVGVELSVGHLGRGFDVDLGPEIEEGPVDVDAVEMDLDSIWFDEHEQFEGGTIIGEVHVTATITYSVCVFKATYYGAPDDVSWHVTDSDWNEHYVRVSGQFIGELTYQFTVIEGYERPDSLILEQLVQVTLNS